MDLKAVQMEDKSYSREAHIQKAKLKKLTFCFEIINTFLLLLLLLFFFATFNLWNYCKKTCKPFIPKLKSYSKDPQQRTI